ncbi:tctex1 domain-containing protein 1 [Lingula anatina]|uniref:Tctex1 domain-containing protein 1 n=1 Tax=Lingula anatina TaxID=7574 RepID=A0A1S3J997_LINAN|nr:tctex1 domain-containing protein 1 [Lingula anatina]|eukprot:XP_013406977.1 tctex1 domain-containing protein 1 [Lingula anatina]
MSRLHMPHTLQTKSSLFAVGHRQAAPSGSSVTAFGCGPKHDFDHDHHKKERMVCYENTYQMDPPTKFKPERVNVIIRDVLHQFLNGKEYDPIQCSVLTKEIAKEIKKRVKELGFARYKFVSVVNIGQKKDQCVRVGSRCIWDVERDNFASDTFESPHMYAVGVVFAVYFE